MIQIFLVIFQIEQMLLLSFGLFLFVLKLRHQLNVLVSGVLDLLHEASDLLRVVLSDVQFHQLIALVVLQPLQLLDFPQQLLALVLSQADLVLQVHHLLGISHNALLLHHLQLLLRYNYLFLSVGHLPFPGLHLGVHPLSDLLDVIFPRFQLCLQSVDVHLMPAVKLFRQQFVRFHLLLSGLNHQLIHLLIQLFQSVSQLHVPFFQLLNGQVFLLNAQLVLS